MAALKPRRPKSAVPASGAARTPSRSPLRNRERDLQRVRFRRALTLVAMTLVLPGSAQLVAGNRRIGHLAVRVFLSVLGLGLILLLITLVSPGFLITLGTNPFWLGVSRLAIAALAIGWFALFVDAWRLGRPLELGKRQRLWMAGINGVVAFTVTGVMLYGAHILAVHREFVVTFFGNGPASAPNQGRYNVLLLGGDAGLDRWGMRPDAITLASIDVETGKSILFGLPRNMTNFPFPEDSPLAADFPEGYDCPDCTLNSLATYAQGKPELYPDSDYAPVQATIDGVEGITGLQVNYFAMVNMDGFRHMVNALGGLTLNVRDPIPIGKTGAIEGYIEPGIRKLNGFEVLWYTRSRADSDDYSRMARQKCALNAMMQQLHPSNVIRRYGDITQAASGMLSTNLPRSELDSFAELALRAKGQPVRTVSFVPPLVSTSNPDIDVIHEMVQLALDGKRVRLALAEPEPEPTASPSESVDAGSDGSTVDPEAGFATDEAVTTGGSKGSMSQGYLANEAEDLTAAC